MMVDNSRKLILLVHGTWARQLIYLNPRQKNCVSSWKDFRIILKENFHITDKQIKEFDWSGWNRQYSRKKASEELVCKINNLLAENNVDQLVLISHSHGFEVIEEAIKSIDDVTKISQIVAFNSPNIISLKRDFFRNLDFNFKFIGVALLITSVVLMSKYALGFWLDWSKVGANLFGQFIQQGIFPLVLLLVGIVLITRNVRSEKSCFDKQHSVPVFAINSSGDEAWNFLSLFTSLNQIPFYLAHKGILLIVALVVWFRNFHNIGKNENIEPEFLHNISRLRTY